MKKILVLVFSITFVFYLYGCYQNEQKLSNSAIQKNVIASEQSLPNNFEEVANKNEETPNLLFLVRIASSEMEQKKLWTEFNMPSDVQQIDFNNNDAYFIGTFESSSCPIKIENIEYKDRKIQLTLSQPDGNCTSDLAPRNFVLKIEKDISSNMESFEINLSGKNTSIPIRNKNS